MSQEVATTGQAETPQPATPSARAPSPLENYRKLGPRLRRFAELVAGGESNVQAARTLRPRSKEPKKLGWYWRHLPTVDAAIEELQADAKAAFLSREVRHRTGIYNRANADRSLLTAAALFGAEKVGLPEDPREWPQELRDCIEGVKQTRYGPEVVLSDRNTAARLHSQHMGWMTEKHELTGPNGGPLQSVAIATDDPAEAARAYQELIRG